MRLIIIDQLDDYISQEHKIELQQNKNVTYCEDTNHAIDALLNGEEADLVMVDANQDIQGFIDRLKKERLYIPVVAYGLPTDEYAPVKAIEQGAQEYVPLPPNSDLIVSAINAVTEEQSDMIANDPTMDDVINLANKIASNAITQDNLSESKRLGYNKERFTGKMSLDIALLKRTHMFKILLIISCLWIGIGWYQVSIFKSNAIVKTQHSSSMTGSSIGGGFSLIDHNGIAVSEADFSGDYQLIYFGFTYCPTICPTELQKITQVLNKLGSAGNQIQPLFITIDPSRDTPAVMKDYVELFHERFIGLTGSQAQVDKVLKDYHVYANMVEDETMSDYTMDHSSYIYFMNPYNQLMAIYHMEDNVDFIAQDIRTHL